MRIIGWLGLIGLGVAGTAGAKPRETLTVLSFNVRVAVASDGANDWPHRRDLFAATVRKANPDIIGTQELLQVQADDIIVRLPAYTWFGRDRRGGHGDEHMGIFYRRDRLTLLRHGDFWLSDTPEVVGSITWGHPLPRMVNWGEFRTRSGRTFYLFDTHFPYRDEDEAARGKAAALVAARIPTIAGKSPVVLTGDFNTTPTSEAYRTLTGTLTDVRAAAPHSGPEGTFHGFTGVPERRIDWILVHGLHPLSAATLTDHRGALYPSDHFPIVARLAFQP